VFHHAILLEGVFDRAPVVWARFIKHLVKNSRATLGRGPKVLALDGSHKGILTRLLSLLFLLGVAARATFVGVLLLLLLSLGVMENCPYRLLTRSKVGGNIQELPGGVWAVAPQLVDELLAGGSCEERPNDIGVSHVGQLSALSGEALNVLTESFIQLLAEAPEVLGISRADISALEVPHENLHEVGPVVDASAWKMFQPGSR
jgi:hypothetical protein